MLFLNKWCHKTSICCSISCTAGAAVQGCIMCHLKLREAIFFETPDCGGLAHADKDLLTQAVPLKPLLSSKCELTSLSFIGHL